MPSLSFGARGVDLLARGHQLVDHAIDREVEVRDVLRRRSEALRDDAAHVVVRDDLVGAFLVERTHLVVGGKRERRAGRRSGCPGRPPTARRPDAFRPLPSFAAFHVARDHAAMRARARDARDVDAGVLRHAARQRRREHAARGRWWPARARQRAQEPQSFGASVFGGRRAAAAGAAALEPRRPSARARWPRPNAAALASSPSPASTAINWFTGTSVVPSGTTDLRQRALVDRLDFHRRLVGLDLGDHVARA